MIKYAKTYIVVSNHLRVSLKSTIFAADFILTTNEE